MIRHHLRGLRRPHGRPRLLLAVAGLVLGSVLALQQRFVQVVKRVGPSVVLIQTSQGLGSGIVFDANGNIVTNAHVVQGASRFQVSLADGRQDRARLVAALGPTTWPCSTSPPAGCTRPASPAPAASRSGT